VDINLNKSGIYSITNIINNKIYIGSAKSFSNRWNKHKSDLMANRHHSNHLQNAWNMYKPNNFEFKIIEIIENVKNLI
jgi:group I intron endonuclease